MNIPAGTISIHYTIASSPLGRLLVAATGRGLCFAALGDDDHSLEEALRAEFPQRPLSAQAAALEPYVRALLAHLAGEQRDLDLPLDVQATPFQQRVWQALAAIPYGSTRTYGEIARQLGMSNGARAVGHACASNPLALAIPCHRALRSDGGLGGYRWGLARKRALLDQERGAARLI